MPRLILALLLAVAAEAAALACSCVPPPEDPVARRTLAREIAQRALALVEVELVAPYGAQPGRGERLRVRRTLAGRAPAAFEVERFADPSSAACDVQFQSGARALIVVYPPRNRVAGLYRISSSCASYLLGDAALRTALVDEIDRRR